MNEGRILILTGPPGTGKSTVADQLASTSRSPAVHLHTDDFYGAIRSGYVEPWLREAHEQNKTVISSIAATALAFASGGYFVVVDGIVGPWFLDAFRRSSIPTTYLVLMPDIAVAQLRATQRAKSFNDALVIAELHRQFSEWPEIGQHAIDTGEETVDVTVERVRCALVDARFTI